jgi:hypothetical protein
VQRIGGTDVTAIAAVSLHNPNLELSKEKRQTMVIDRSVLFTALAVIAMTLACGLWMHRQDGVTNQPTVPTHIIMNTPVPCPQIPNPLCANGTDCC